MPLKESEAIVLRTYPLGEGDRLGRAHDDRPGERVSGWTAILAGRPGEPIPLYQSRKQQPVPAGTDTLF